MILVCFKKQEQSTLEACVSYFCFCFDLNTGLKAIARSLFREIRSVSKLGAALFVCDDDDMIPTTGSHEIRKKFCGD